MLKCLMSGWSLAAVAVAAAAGPVPPSDPAAVEAYRRLPYCRLAPDGQRLAEEPCRRPPTRGFAERRAAPALPMPSPPPSRPQAREPGHAWHPTLVPHAVPGTPIATGRAAPPGASALPVPPVQPLNPCGIAGCRGADGTWYLPGAGDIVLDPSGRMCTRQGLWVHCP